MKPPPLVLLPGMHGTADLFAPLLSVLPPSTPRRVVTYPPQRVTAYAELLETLVHELDNTEPCVLIAESYGGPLALRYAAAFPQRVRAIILAASFVRSPALSWLRVFAGPFTFRLPLQYLAIRTFLCNATADPQTLATAVASAVAPVRPAVLSARLREILRIDCTAALSKCTAPILYLQAQQDRVVRAHCLQTIQHYRPTVAVRTLAGPHMLLQSAPAAAWREIAAFLDQLRLPAHSTAPQHAAVL